MTYQAITKTVMEKRSAKKNGFEPSGIKPSGNIPEIDTRNQTVNVRSESVTTNGTKIFEILSAYF